MSVYFSELEEIYFLETKEYFQEVISSYSIGNYRSATVMLYSVAICDILLKLRELKDMYNDTVAEKILNEIEKSRNSHDNKSKSRWEKELVDQIFKETELLDLEAYTNLNHLYDYRNFSAHPALNDNYELIAPSKETTIANIKNILKDILIKPPVFIKNIVNTLTEDLKYKKDLYKNEYSKLVIYLNNKYFSKMSNSMKLVTLKSFWKFCFCLPDDEECQNNLVINRKALEILISSFQQEAVNYIKEKKHLFTVANNESSQMNLVILLSRFPILYNELYSDTKLQVDAIIKKDNRAKSIAWFKYKSTEEHLSSLKSNPIIKLEANAIKRMVSHYSDVGEMTKLIDFFIWYYGKSHNYDSADSRFKLVIEPYLDGMSAIQFEQLIKNSNGNRQIWNRGLAYTANNKIMKHAKGVLDDDFDFSAYSKFNFDDNIIQENQDEEIDSGEEFDFVFEN